ncbi:MAG: IclR family transcriptional regulator [Solimonas sp.]
MLTDERRLNSPQSVTRVIRILEALCASEKPVSLAQLSRVLGAPKSSLAALLRGLVEADFIVAAEGFYRLGPAAFGLGSALLEARRRLQSPDLVREGMRRLAERSRETVLFAVRDMDSGTLTYVDFVESRAAVRFAISIGDRRPLYCTAGGRVLLAALPDGELRAYLRSLKPQRLTAETEVEKRALGAIIAQARETGVAQTVNQAADDVSGSAAAIFNAAGKAIGALVVAAPSSRSQNRRGELARLVHDEAVAISATLGYRRPARAS